MHMRNFQQAQNQRSEYRGTLSPTLPLSAPIPRVGSTIIEDQGLKIRGFCAPAEVIISMQGLGSAPDEAFVMVTDLH